VWFVIREQKERVQRDVCDLSH